MIDAMTRPFHTAVKAHDRLKLRQLILYKKRPDEEFYRLGFLKKLHDTYCTVSTDTDFGHDDSYFDTDAYLDTVIPFPTIADSAQIGGFVLTGKKTEIDGSYRLYQVEKIEDKRLVARDGCGTKHTFERSEVRPVIPF
jgi:hypothetical protein